MADNNTRLRSPFADLAREGLPRLDTSSARPPAPAPRAAAPRQQPAVDSLLPPANVRGAFDSVATEYGVPVNVLMALPIDPSNPAQSMRASAQQIRERLNSGQSIEDALNEFSGGQGGDVLARVRQIGEALMAEDADRYGAVSQRAAPQQAQVPGQPAAAAPAAGQPTGPELRNWEPGFWDRVAQFFSSPNRDAAAVEATARRIAKEQGISVNEVYRQAGGRRTFRADPEGRGFGEALRQGWQTAGYEAARAGEEAPPVPADEQGLLSRMGESTVAGYENMVDAMAVSRFALGGGDADSLAEGLAEKIQRNQARESGRTRGERESQAAFGAVSDATGMVEALGAGLRALGVAGGNPGDTAVGIAEQSANMLPAIAGGAGGAATGAATGGAVAGQPGAVGGAIIGGRLGMAAGTAAIELGTEIESEITDRLNKDGKQPTAENIKELLQDPEFMREAVALGARKGLTLAAVDQLFMGLSGRVATTPMRQATREAIESGTEVARPSLGRRAAYGAAATGIESVGEGASEAAGQLAARGEIDAGEALQESIYGFGTAVAGATIGGAMETARARYEASPEARHRNIAMEMERAIADAEFVESADTIARRSFDPNAQAGIAMDEPAPSGPIGRALDAGRAAARERVAQVAQAEAEAAAVAAEQDMLAQPSGERVTVTAGDGSIEGVLESYTDDGQGRFSARVVTDDGMAYDFTQDDGVAITPVEAQQEAAAEAEAMAAAAAQAVLEGQQEAAAPARPVAPVEPAAATPVEGYEYRSDGRPFSSPEVARRAAKNRRLEGYEPVEVEGGWALAQTAEAQPAEAEAVADAPVEIPSRETGKAGTVTTPAGRDMDVEYRVVEASDLTTSNFDDGRVNPDYPKELQPRDRSRAASQDQVRDIASRINPRLLGESPSTTDGAPIVSPDGIVESGNGRTLALRRAYGMDNAGEYRQWLADQGYDIEGMQQPVLVRVRRTDMTPDELVEYTRESNERTTLEMSATEQAMADADSLGSIIEDYKGGDINSAANRDFVRKFVRDVVGRSERGGMADAQGHLSQEGRRRVEAALLAAAYGDPGLVTDVFESVDTEIKAIGGALLDAAGRWAQMRQASRESTIADGLDVTPNLIEAVNTIRRARSEGRPLSELVATDDMFGGRIDPRTEAFLRIFYRGDALRRARGREKVAEALNDYANRALESQPGDGLFGDNVTADQLVGSVNERLRQQEEAGRGQSDLFGAARAQPATRDTGESGGERQGSLPETVRQPAAEDARAEPEQSGALSGGRPVIAEGQAINAPLATVEATPLGNRPFWRETNTNGLDTLILQGIGDDVQYIANLFVTDDITLAIGQGDNAGIMVRLRGDALSGSEHRKPGAGVIGGREYVVNGVAPDFIDEIFMPADTPLRGLAKRELRKFDMEDLGNGYRRYTRKGVEAGPTPDFVAERLPVPEGAIFKADGQPFASETAAKSHISRRKLDGYAPAEVSGGWVAAPVQEGGQASGYDASSKLVSRERADEQQRRDEGQRGIYDRRVDDMTREEMKEYIEQLRAEVLVDERTGLGSNRAWLNREPKAFVASIDLDSLKWVNDNMGHAAGDRMIALVGDSMREAGIAEDSYHVSGDEFYAQADTAEQLADALTRAQQWLAGQTITEGGIEYTGPGFSYGIGTDINAAERGLHEHKQQREAAGERAARGERPAGAVDAAGRDQQRPADEGRSEEATADRESEGAERPQPDVRPSDYGASNRLVSQDRAEELRQRLRAKLNQIQSGIDPETMAIGVELAAFHIEAGARKFIDFARAIANDLGTTPANVRRYLRSWYNGARDLMEDSGIDVSGMDTPDQVRADLNTLTEESDNAQRAAENTERDSPAGEAPAVAGDIADAGRGSVGQGAAEAGTQASEGRGAGDAVGDGGAAAAGERGNKPVPSDKSKLEQSAARDTDDRGSLPDSTGGLFAERKAGSEPGRSAGAAPASIPKLNAGEGATVTTGNLAQIKEQMPFLTDGQAEDVAFAERRFSKPDGFGVLFTNGTGTGKTFSALGIAKRMSMAGKGNILVAVPKQTIVDAWIRAGDKFFNLPIDRLKSTKDAGQGIVITTYANLGDNQALLNREWDAVLADEAHYLSSDQKGSDTKALAALRAMTLKRGTAQDRVYAQHPDKVEKMQELYNRAEVYSASDNEQLWHQVEGLREQANAIRRELEDLTAKEQARVDAIPDADKPRAVFLSATPFSYEKSVQWANEFLFDWGTDQNDLAYNAGDNFERFMMQHFGYRMRYNKLTEPDARVDRGLMQRAFNTWLHREGVLSGRALDSEFDYDRHFILAESALGRRVDAAIEWIRERSRGDDAIQGMEELQKKLIDDNFDYHSRMYFLEAIKAREAVPHIRDHVAKGRKVLVMHDFKKGGAVNPFRITPTDETRAAYEAFKAEFGDLINAFSRIPSPIDLLSSEFPDALVYNGSVSAKKRVEMQDRFNSDADDAPRVMIAQGDAMREGVSIHDTTGKFPRVMIHLGMPVKPTAAIQQEGRTYRTGQASNAMFRYLTIGSSWERLAFASKIASRASAAENLAMGEQARGLKQAFIDAYENAGDFPAGFEGEGTGGREADGAYANQLTPWDMAKAFYFGTKQQGRGRSARGREHSEFFATPEPLGLKMVQWADVRGGEKTLEPSAGHGAIARWFPENAENRAIELTHDLSSRLALHFDGDLLTGDFMDHNIVNKYDAIVMNPPFGQGGKQAAEHVEKAMRHLRDGGRIVALIPTGPAADKRFSALLESDAAKDIYLAAEIKLPSVTFERAGTSVATRVLVLEKQTDPDVAAQIQQASRDYSGAQTIEELFDRLESSEIQPRLKPESTAEASPATAGSMETWDATHTKTGDPVYMAKPRARLDRDQYGQVLAVARQHGGYWSRFGKAGFLFKSAEDRQAFVDAVSAGGGEAAGARFSIAPPTDSAAFSRWFGDSPNVDGDGQPILFYHSGDASFTGIRDTGRFGAGIFVREGRPAGYGGAEYALYLRDPILELDALEDLLDSDAGRDALSKRLPNTDEDVLDAVAEALASSEHYPTDEAVWEAIGAIDEADAQVEIQTLRGQIAADLGYSAVRQPDEFDGETVMVMNPSAIKSATDNRGTYDQANPDIRYSASESAGSFADAASLDQRLRSGTMGHFIGRLIDSGRVVLHDTARSMPRKQKGSAALTTLDGTIHLAANMLTDNSALPVLMHEAFHSGVERLIGSSQWDGMMKRLGSLYRQGERSTGRARQFWDEAAARVQYAERLGVAMGDKLMAEEFGAYAIEQYESAPQSVRRWIDDMVGMVKAWAQRFFGIQLGRVTPAQLRALAAMAIRSDVADRAGIRAEPAFSAGDQTTTPEFSRWFGDSKVVDESGQPLVVYHGTAADFSAFRADGEPNTEGGYDLYSRGVRAFFFTPDPDVAAEYAGAVAGSSRTAGDTVMPVYLSLKNPLVIDANGDGWGAFQDQIETAYKGGQYDGVILRNVEDGMFEAETGDVYVAFRPEQIKSAIGNIGTFDPDNPDIRYSVKPSKHFKDLNEIQKGIFDKVGSQRLPVRLRDRFDQLTENLALRVRQAGVDRYAALLRNDQALLGEDTLEGSIASSSWVLARMSEAAGGALSAMVNAGRIYLDADQKVIDVREGTKGFAETLRKLGSPQEIDRFFIWVAMNRSNKLEKEGRENLFTREEIREGMKLSGGKLENGKSRSILYAKVWGEFQQFRDDVLGIAEQAGIITPEQRATWADEFYVPFYRVLDEDTIGGPRSGSGLSRQQAYKRLKGGKSNLNDLLDNTLLNFHHLIQASLKNQAAIQAVDNALELDIAEKITEARRSKKVSTFIMRGGEKEWYNINDPLTFKALSALSDAGMNNTAMKVGRAFKRFFTNMITVTPKFVIANTTRDTLSAVATSPVSFNPVRNAIQGAMTYGNDFNKARMLASGAAFSFGHVYGRNPDEVKASLTKDLRNAKLLSDPKMVPKMLVGAWRKWNRATDFAENINRAAIWEQNQERGKLKAAFEARDLVDFSARGDAVLIRILADLVPFMNARIQGLDKLYRSGIKPGAKTLSGRGTKADRKAFARFAAVVGALSAVSIALYLRNYDDEEYRKLEDWQRDTYWVVRIGDSMFFIPKPFEVGAIATMAERTTEQFVDDKVGGRKFAERLGHMLSETFSLDPIPQAVKPVYEMSVNRNTFTGRPIEGLGDQRLSPSLRTRPETSMFAEYLSRGMEGALGLVSDDARDAALSPLQIDHLIAGYTGDVGSFAAATADTLWRRAMGEEQPAKHWYEYQPIKRFYRDLTDEENYNRYGTLFYDTMKKADRAYADLNRLQEYGELERAYKVEQSNELHLAMRRNLNQTSRSLGQINREMRHIKMDKKMSGEAKRLELDRLRSLRNMILENVGKEIEEQEAARR